MPEENEESMQVEIRASREARCARKCRANIDPEPHRTRKDTATKNEEITGRVNCRWKVR